MNIIEAFSISKDTGKYIFRKSWKNIESNICMKELYYLVKDEEIIAIYKNKEFDISNDKEDINFNIFLSDILCNDWEIKE